MANKTPTTKTPGNKSQWQTKEHATLIAEMLKQENPTPVTELTHENELQLAVAVMLSAQTTDKKVNQITPNLFKKYKTWEDLANAQLPEITDEIYGVNFHKGKAERLIAAGKVVVAMFAGHLPKTIAELTTIPGIGRKSANVILNEIWNIAEGIVVDTHISRVSARLGLTTNTDPVKIEKDLMGIVPKEYWRNLSSAMVLHGRYICVARKPKCQECKLNKVCPSAFKE